MRSAQQRRLRVIPASVIGEEHYISAGGQRVRVNVRQGTGVPLALCNGIGASMEVLDPLVEQLDSTVVRFDVPGTGGSPTSLLPYGFPYLAWVLGRVLSKLEIGVVDVLGLSWGGALAQQFAFQNPRRCRRLVLVATGTGALMVPAHPRVLAKMITPRRFSDPDYAASIAGELYGGTVRAHGEDVAQLFVRQVRAGSKVGYLHQLLAGSVWTSLFALPAVRQETLIVAGTDDPIIPVVNARIMHALLPHSLLHLHSGGHIDLVHNAAELAPVIDTFLSEPGERP
jgi:poly(3-hydroxyalkanoate) depolymerase